MELEQKIKMLQVIYAGALADSVLRMGKEGILEKVALEKRENKCTPENIVHRNLELINRKMYF